MARLVLGVAGAYVGSLFGQPQLGFMIGSAIGGTFEPNQKQQGPRLDDLKVTGSSYGTTIPFVVGAPRIAGQIVWASAKREIATTSTQSGKGGGGGVENTNYTYEVDLLILLSDNVIPGVRRVWNNGKLVQDANNAASLWRRLTSYSGVADQLPDPTYEASVGTANACAYRGRGTVFIQGLQLGGSGSIPNLTFEIQAPSTYGTNQSLLVSGFVTRRDTDPGPLDAFDIAYAGTSTYNNYFDEFGTDALLLPNYGGTGVRVGYSLTVTTGGQKTLPIDVGATYALSAGNNFYSGDEINFTLEFMNDTGAVLASMSMLKAGTVSPFTHRFSIGTAAPTTYLHENVTTNNRISFTTTALVVTNAGGSGFDGSAGRSFSIPCAGKTITKVRATVGTMKSADYFTSDNPNCFVRLQKVGALDYIPSPIDGPSVAAVVSQICSMAGLSAGQFDVSALSTSTPVRALSSSQISNSRALLELLANTYHFEVSASDKLYFRQRGGAAVVSVPYDELGCDNNDPITINDSGELELPAQFAISYPNIEADYQTATEYSDRLLAGQTNVNAVQMPIAMLSSEAKTLADGLLFDRVVSSRSTTVALSLKYAALEPADVLTVTDYHGAGWRMRVVKRVDTGGYIKLDLVSDNASVFTQSGVTSSASGQVSVEAAPSVNLALLDIPMLQDSDDYSLVYVAAKGMGNYTAGVYYSANASVYDLNATILNAAIFGTATTALGGHTGALVFDEANTFQVNVGDGQLSSVTRDAMLEDRNVNVALVGDEVVQFRTATLVSAGVYNISGLLRGLRGTDWACSAHVSGERFVLLTTRGFAVLPLSPSGSDIGRLRYYKGAAPTQILSAANTRTITPTGANLKPFSPCMLRANRATTDTALTWVRRTRYTTRMTGVLGIFAPLGEAVELYDVEVYDSGSFTTIKRTFSNLTTPTATYTNAQQVTDFGSGQSVLYVKVYQRNAVVGRGYALTGSV